MKSIASVFVLFAQSAKASLLAIITVKQPLYLAGSGGGDEILVREVQVVSHGAGPEADFRAIVLPFTPPSDGTWKQPGNVNIASLAGIKIRVAEAGGGGMEVVVDATSAKVPPNVAFTIDDVVVATVRCVKEIASAQGRKVTIMVEKPANPEGDKPAHPTAGNVLL